MEVAKGVGASEVFFQSGLAFLGEVLRNILNERPKEVQNLEGRLKFSCEFVAKNDLRDKRVLDIGCGFGWFEKYCLEQGVRSVDAIEHTAKDLQTAKDGIQSDRVFFQEGSALKLPFADNTFDTVVSWEVIEHIPRGCEMQMFGEIQRVLKPDGVFYISTPYRSWLSTALDPAWWLIGHRHYRQNKLEAFAQGAGLRCVETRLKGRIWEILGWWNLYIAKWIFRRGVFFESFFTRKINAEFRIDAVGYTNIFQKYLVN